MIDDFEYVERRQYDCDNESLFELIKDVNKYQDDTPEARRYYYLLGFKFDAREVHDFCGITTYFTSWMFGVNENKRTSSTSLCEKGIISRFNLVEGVDYVVLKNTKKRGRANIPQREVLLKSNVVELLLLRSKKTREQAIQNMEHLMLCIQRIMTDK